MEPRKLNSSCFFNKIIAAFTILLVAMPQSAWAQSSASLPMKVDAGKAKITQVGHATMAVHQEVRVDSITMCADTVCVVDTVMWNTVEGTAKNLMARARRAPLSGSDFYDGDSSWWRDIYWFSYTYPSVNSKGEPCVLSSLACMPDNDCDSVNNVVIGCHATIVAQRECPTSMNIKGIGDTNDVEFFMNHASSGWVFHSSEDDAPYYNLVIIPDYEGYGITSDVAHPYLSEELTARQVVDGVRYGIELYKNSAQVSAIRHPFRSGWRSVSVGYSQGGGTSMAVHRFIEQNGLVDELKFTGSVCGDGPYNPVATFMEYINQAENDEVMTMIIVMPLILKGMCDSNPYMRNHKVSDYLSDKFLETGIIDWINNKEYSHDDIKKKWEELIEKGKGDDEDYYKDVLGSNGIGYLKNVLRPELYAYFKNYLDPANPTYTVTHSLLDDKGFPVDFIDFHVFDPDRPTSRGLMEDLHLALSYNNLTRGWNPEHPLYLYHSVNDKAVPVCNRSSAAYYFGKWGKIIDSAFGNDHVSTAIQFLLGFEEFDAIRDLSEADIHPSKETLGMAEPVVKGNLLVDGNDVEAEYVIRDGKAILGTGYNACISQYLFGKVEVPGSITIKGKEYQVAAVNDMAFRMCSYITHVTLPEGVTRIGDFAFYGCLGLLGADLPSTLKTIGTGAFIDLPNLTKLFLRAQTPPKWEYNDVFCFHSGGIGDANAYTTDNTILYVPEGCVHTYEMTVYSNRSLGWTTASGWDYFTHIKSIVDYAPEAYAVYADGTLSFYYDGRIATRQGRVYRLNEGEHFPGWSDTFGGGPTGSSDPEDHSKDITKVVFSPSFRDARPTSTFGWFSDCVNLTSIEGWENLNTSEVKLMDYMFSNCSQLTSDALDFSHFDTSKVEFFSFMFRGCKGLTTLDLSDFNTSKAEWFNNMFEDCSNLTSLDISHFDTREGAEFDSMFSGCSSLENIDLSNFYMQKAVHTGEMFFGCISLKTLTIPTVISKVRDMFIGCSNMEHVYFYGTKPFEHWGQDRHVSFAPNEKTLFHVLHGTANAWKDAYQVEEEGLNWRANCTFVDDLGTDGNEILIYHEGDWANLQDMVDMGFTNISAKLMNDVSITSSIGTRKNPFSGTFDGNGHKLNTFILNYVDAVGVFNNISGATIKNLHVAGDVHGSVCTGGIVGVVQGDNNLIENCRVSANVGSMANSSNGPHVGGFIGHGLAYTNTIRGCLFDGKLCVLQDEKLHDSYAGVFFGWCSNPSKQKVEDSMAKGSFDSSFQHKGLNYDESGKSSSVQVTNTYHFQSWKEGKRAYSITCESETFHLSFGTPVTTYGVSGIDVYDDGITQDGTFYAGDLERVNMSIVGVEGYDFSINSFAAKDAYLMVDYQHPGNFIVGIAGSDVVIEVSPNLETFYIFDNERNSKRLLDIVGKFEGYDVCLSGRTLYRDGSWNTLCLPFDVSDIAGTPLEGAQVKTLEGVEYENLTLTLHFGKDLTSLEAGMPYIVRWERPEYYVAFDGNNFRSTSDLVNPLFTGVTITMSIPRYTWFDFNDDGIMDVGFRGLFNPMDVGENHSMVYLGSDNKLYYSNGNMRVNACRAYFVLNGIFANEKGDGINNFVLNFDNGQTGISSSMLEGSGCSDETWYSMDGRKLNAKPKAKGVYVSNGKKIFIK